MALEEHLTELSKRFIVIIAAIALLTLATLPFSKVLIQVFQRDLLPEGTMLIVLNPIEYMYMRIKIAIACALIVSIPLIIYEIFKFVKPGLFPSERIFFIRIVPTSLILFLLGSSFAYTVLAPFSIQFLIGYAEGTATPMLVLNRFISFISFMLLSFALIFQFPLIISFLVKAGLVEPEDLKKKRKFVYPLILIGAMVIAPDPTPVTPLIIATSLILMYEISSIIAKYLI
jgi:sec-independent protein translocase protein TatC